MTKMTAKKMADMLEDYEQKAYAGYFGVDWLAAAGENLKKYMINCHLEKREPTFEGLLQWITDLHIKAMA
ncbi:hypothetical protein [Bacillus pumilus]|uniref:hypothetical protein n=1 Tax=Bacillus pumilus TaxID=1408 RepID=UPI002282D2E2|nr:hypothetical protein [Bacillus pumilus]MCY7500158.1 hypothetical protein [Bacillus pumilus]MCY7528518.1 hypothetical protein [Bacillus pumilus]MED4439524.1 hypothetical protein [Bacillus pumilus]MED4489967.1 hypothetical protein [Bacillus pumilus]